MRFIFIFFTYNTRPRNGLLSKQHEPMWSMYVLIVVKPLPDRENNSNRSIKQRQAQKPIKVL